MIKKYNKLVRDNIPEIIRQDGRSPKTNILNNKKYKDELFKKVVEEATELMNAKNKKEMIKEIGDVYEVISAIVDLMGFDRNIIIDVQNKRRKKRGGFKKKIFLESVN